ncbi:tudor domain-containing protein 1 isoform X2 [Nelusetta ayraudi]
MGKSMMPGCLTPTRYCNYCGQQGQFRCMRCKKTSYCSVACQAEDWKAHRHMCQTAESEPLPADPVDITVPLVSGENLGLLDPKPDGASSHRRIYMKDLQTFKVTKGTEIQACVVECHNPGRFFLHTQTPEVIKMLQTISMELQKTYNCPQAVTYTPCVDELCAVQFSSDMNWYRGLVQALAADQKKAKVLYIDFGNEEDVPVERIKPLAAEIQPFFPCAMECYIAGVVPLTGTWSAESCIAVKQLIGGKTVKVKLLGTEENGHVHAVDILLSKGLQLSSFLIEHSYAAEKDNPAPSVQEIHAMVNASLENFKRLSIGKDDNTWAQPPESLTQAVGDSFYVVVTHLQSPNEIIVQKVENARAIQELQMKLRDYYSQVSPPQNFRPAPGTVCCAQFSEDKQWYRAKVLAYASEERVCVGYVDFGNSEEVELSHLQPITPSLLELPMQAFPCALAGLQPVGESWSKDCIVALQRQVSNRILRIEIQGAHEGKALVALIDEGSDPQVNVAELLTSAGFSVPASAMGGGDHQLEQKAVISAKKQGSEAEIKADVKGNESNQEQVQPASQAGGLQQEPAAAAAAAATAPELQPDSPSFPVTWKTVKLPSKESFHPCIAAVVSPALFYLFNSSQTDQQKLEKVIMQLNAHCSSSSSLSPADLGTLAPGAACCARFSGDNNWYRAVVLEIGKEEISVLYADYGNTEKLPFSQIAPIPKNLLELPFQIIRCALVGHESFPAEWPEEVLVTFKRLLSEGVVATALHFDGFANVLSLNQASGGSVSEILAVLQAEPDDKPTLQQASGASPVENSGQNILMEAGTPSIHPTQSANSAKPEDSVNSAPCSCKQRLERKIDRLESLTEQLIALHKQFMEEIQKEN